MVPGINKRSFLGRGVVLAIVFAATAGYWYKFFEGSGGIWVAGAGTLIAALIVLFSEHKRLLVVVALQVLVGLGLFGLLRKLISGESIIPGLIAFGFVLALLFVVGGRHQDTTWLLKEDEWGDNVNSTELNLRLDKEQDRNP